VTIYVEFFLKEEGKLSNVISGGVAYIYAERTVGLLSLELEKVAANKHTWVVLVLRFKAI